jgi:uncharacterized protein (TIGR04255 family)
LLDHPIICAGFKMPQLYKRPPITEAVIEIRIDSPIAMDRVERIRERLVEAYPLPPQKVMLLNFEFQEQSPRVQQQLQGYRLTAPDGAGVVTIGPNVIATSRLAPYEGWESFVASGRSNWKIWKRVVGWQKVTRIGVRYINRIDIPTPENEPINVDDYLLFSLRRPDLGLPPLQSFAMNAVTPLGKDDCKLIINAGSMPSPLVKTVSFILDIDISKETDLPQNDEGLWALINRIRDYKNFVFEGCITELSRELFNK